MEVFISVLTCVVIFIIGMAVGWLVDIVLGDDYEY